MSDKNLKLQNPQTFEQPLCSQVSPSFFYIDDDDDDTISEESKNKTYQIAAEICVKCKHIDPCAEWAVRRERWGFWGGLTPQQRILIRRKRKITLNEPQ